MSRTREDLGRKLARLQAHARRMTPRQYAKRMVRQSWFERSIGSILVLAGSVMAWRRYPRRTRA